MEKNVAKACYEEKLKFLCRALDELIAVLFAFDTTVIADYRLYSPDTGYEEPKRTTFSEAFTLWDDHTTKRDMDPETIEKKIMAAVKDFPEIESFIKGDEPDFPELQFSGDPHEFVTKLFSILFLLVNAGEKGDPRADLLAMRALYDASSIITRLEMEGKRRTDIPYKAGSSKWKKKVDKQDVIEMFYQIETDGMSKRAMSHAVRDEFIRRRENHKGEELTDAEKEKIYVPKSIRRILKKAGVKEFS